MFDGRESGKPYVTLEGEASSELCWLTGPVASPPGLTRPPFYEAIQLPFRQCSKGESFGPSWSTHWFRVTLRLPKHFLEKVRRCLLWSDSRNELSFISIAIAKE